VISRAAAAETAMPLEVVPAAITGRALGPVAVAAHPAWDREAEAEVEAVGVEVDAEGR
jgi:hypothetical protein